MYPDQVNMTLKTTKMGIIIYQSIRMLVQENLAHQQDYIWVSLLLIRQDQAIIDLQVILATLTLKNTSIHITILISPLKQLNRQEWQE